MIESAAEAHAISRGFLTRLIWRESSFRPHVVSHAGAQGIAQFMPGTAADRGLADPFDPEQAIPKAAELLSDLKIRFGNYGLAAAAYNGGPRRVTDWLTSGGLLPTETREFVVRITRQPVETWAARVFGEGAAAEEPETTDAPSDDDETEGCLDLLASLRNGGDTAVTFASLSPAQADTAPFVPPGVFVPGVPPPRPKATAPAPPTITPWGVQIAGNFSRDLAVAAFERERRRLRDVIGDARPMVIGTRMRNRGNATFYQVRAPAQTRKEAEDLCGRIRRAGGSCVVARS